jgi:hypothetical protein
MFVQKFLSVTGAVCALLVMWTTSATASPIHICNTGEWDAACGTAPNSGLDYNYSIAYLTGWRKGEILPLRSDAVDRQAREVRLWH